VSEGGWVAPIVAADDSTVSYVIAIVAPGTTYEENGLYQNSARLSAARATQSEIDEYVKITREVSEIVRARLNHANDSRIAARAAAAQSKLSALRQNLVYRVTDLPATVPDGAQLTRWRWQTMDFDPAPFWKRVRQPVLVVLGGNDQNAQAASSVKRIGEALRTGGNRDATFVVFDGANHDLMVPGPGSGFRFMVPAPGYPDTLASWTVSKLNSIRRR
jgi:pimeloyl-ACP methyl ester carboxylesterase